MDVDADASEGSAEGSAPAEVPARARPLVLALVGWTAAAVASGVVVGYLLSWSVFEPDPDILFSSLATFFWSALFGGLTGIVVFVVGTVRSVRRHVPEHRRTRTGATFVGLTVVCAPTAPFALVASVPRPCSLRASHVAPAGGGGAGGRRTTRRRRGGARELAAIRRPRRVRARRRRRDRVSRWDLRLWCTGGRRRTVTHHGRRDQRAAARRECVGA